MCGRYTLQATTNELLERFSAQLVLFDVTPRYNIAPTQKVPVIIETDKRTLDGYKWGLIPFWAKDLKKTRPMINARSETLAEKPSFKTALTRRRCIIPADGFYEWKVDGSEKTPVHIHLAQKEIFALAGLWDSWKSPDGEAVYTCTIITVPSAGWLEDVHDRMPAILTRDAEAAWLAPDNKDPASLLTLLKPYPDTSMAADIVSKAVNSPKVDSPACLDPAAV